MNRPAWATEALRKLTPAQRARLDAIKARKARRGQP